MPPELHYSERFTVAVPTSFRNAVRVAAQSRGLTVADYARVALSDRMQRDAAPHPRLASVASARNLIVLNPKSAQPAKEPA